MQEAATNEQQERFNYPFTQRLTKLLHVAFELFEVGSLILPNNSSAQRVNSPLVDQAYLQRRVL
jgi:hypothetical protein